MARRREADIQKAKEAKQKKLLLLLLPVFLALVAWQGPKMYKSLFAQPAPEATPATTTAPSTVPGATTPAPGAPPTGGLVDSEPLPTAGSDQLFSFSRFTARNPFVAPRAESPSGLETSTAQLTNTAVIEVNGQSEEVAYGATFPASDPVFRLANVTEAGVEVGLASGTFDNGQETVAIAVGEQVQLVGDNGTSYTVRVVSVDFELPCLPGSSAEDCLGGSS